MNKRMFATLMVVLIIELGGLTDMFPASEVPSVQKDDSETQGQAYIETDDGSGYVDLQISRADISVTPRCPRNGEHTKIGVTVCNKGNVDCSAELALFIVHKNSQAFIGTAKVYILPNSSTFTEFFWTAKAGNNMIEVLVQNCVPADFDISNNRASTTISVLPMDNMEKDSSNAIGDLPADRIQPSSMLDIDDNRFEQDIKETCDGFDDDTSLTDPQNAKTIHSGVRSYTKHLPIHISDNSQFTAENGVTGGSGTQNDPYIIEGWDIDAGGNGPCVFIENTEAWFVLRGCYLHNSGSNWGDAGIKLMRVVNGSVESNTLSYNEIGIYLWRSSSNTIANNTISNNRMEGIYLWSSISTSIINNRMVGCGILVVGSDLNQWNTHIIDTSNTVNGKAVQYWIDQTGGTVPTDAGQVILVNCSGVKIENQNVSNGTVGIQIVFSSGITITNNIASNNSMKGISLICSINNILTNNTLSNNNYGITFGSSSNNILTNNTISNNNYGITFDSSINNTIANNTISNNRMEGISLDYSTSNILTNNTMVGCGILVVGSDLNQWNTHIIDTSNTVNGKAVQYWIDQTGGTVPTDAGQVILVNCSGVKIENQNVSNGTVGIQIVFSSGIIIANNTVSNNSRYGIYLWSSSNNIIANNTISNNNYGINLPISNSNTIANNTILNNNYGIYLYGSNSNTIYHNNFINNTIQAYEYYRTSNWSAPYPAGGNYWSDYNGADDGSNDRPAGDGIGDTNIPHLGLDWYPLMQPVDIGDFLLSVIPQVQAVFAGNSTSFNISSFPFCGFSDFVILSAIGVPEGATYSFAPNIIPCNGFSILTINTTLTTLPGIYNLTINAVSGMHVHSATVQLIVQICSNSPPSIVSYSPSETCTIAKNATQTFNITANDVDGDTIEYAWYLDGQQTGTNNPSITISGLTSLGLHTLEVVVSDGKLNVSHIWNITVYDTPPPPSTPSPKPEVESPIVSIIMLLILCLTIVLILIVILKLLWRKHK